VSVYHRYLTVDPSITERFTTLLLDDSNPNSKPRPLEAAKLLLGLARKAARGDYVSPEGKSPYQLLGDWLDVVEKFSDEIGFGVDETVELNNRNAQEVTTATAILQDYDEDEDPLSDRKLNIERIIQQDGLAKYKDQAGRLWTGLATYWIRRGEFDRAKEMFEAGIRSVLTIRDFTQIFDAYAEFCESLISAMMNSLEEGADDENDEEVETEEVEKELDVLMREFEELMDRRPFLVNDVLLRRNPNDVQEWEKRVALWGQDDEKVCQTS
jgi:pre-mRNA-splicing factor SYF1